MSAINEPTSTKNPPINALQKKKSTAAREPITPPIKPTTWPASRSTSPQWNIVDATPSNCLPNNPLALVLQEYGRVAILMIGTTKNNTIHR